MSAETQRERANVERGARVLATCLTGAMFAWRGLSEEQREEYRAVALAVQDAGRPEADAERPEQGHTVQELLDALNTMHEDATQMNTRDIAVTARDYAAVQRAARQVRATLTIHPEPEEHDVG